MILVDDEPLVRAGIRDVLAAQSGIELVGEAGDGLSAVSLIEQSHPDLVFLDVQMPGCDGFEVLEYLEDEARPAVVFVTAYEQYALRAFDAHAIDYLLKPFDDARLLAALERARAWLQRQPTRPSSIPALLDEVQAARTRHRFLVKNAGRLRMVSADEVEWIEARGNYVNLHHSDGPFLMRETLSSLAETLDAGRFQRVHRSAIVALSEIVEVRKRAAGDQELLLRSGSRVPLGRSYRKEFAAKWCS
ncbi:MAG: LytR/AlgR family response regulator transcription factor [Planctomycetota bacterium]